MLNTNGYVIYVVDTETTGTDESIHEPIEISMSRFVLDGSPEPVQNQRTWLLKANNADTISDQALAVNGHLKDDILHKTDFGRQNYLPPGEVIIQIEAWMMEDGMSAMDRVFAGQNPVFDVGFLTKLWARENAIDTFPFELKNNNRIIDTKQLALMVDLCSGQRRLLYNLSSLVKAFKAKKGKAHSAAGDVLMTADLLVKFLNPLRNVVMEHFKDCNAE